MDINLNENHHYLVAVSGGPDSMALLNILYSKGYSFSVAFCNYHTRSASEYEEQMVKEYCASRNIPCYVLDTSSLIKKGNFEAWARDVRYKFFFKIYNEIDAYALLVAHHKDDNIETYIMQKRRKGVVKAYGILAETNVYSMKVIRPLLGYRKRDLLKYCELNNVPYSIDETNLKDDITRNKIRHQIVEKLSEEECEEYLNQIIKKNEEIKTILSVCDKYKNDKYLPCDLLIKENKNAINMIIYEWVTTQVPGLEKKLSFTRIEEIKKMMKSSHPNLILPLNKDNELVKEYDKILIQSKEENNEFFYQINEPCFFDCDEFCIDLKIDTSFLKIYEDSYPLTVRNALPTDKVKFDKVEKSVRRIMIDEKIPLKMRKRYPIFLDCNGKVVYFPLFRSNMQKSIATKLKFMIK